VPVTPAQFITNYPEFADALTAYPQLVQNALDDAYALTPAGVWPPTLIDAGAQLRAAQTLALSPYGRGLKLAGADMIIGVDVNDAKKPWGERFGMTHFVNPKTAGGDLVAHIVNMTKRGADQIGGADYTFDCTGNVAVMRQALEACHRGWGVSVIIGVAGAGQEIATRPFQLVTGRVWKGTAFGGARGRTDVPKIVDWYMDGRIQIDPLITHQMPLERINDSFDLMHSGESIRSVVVY
jgi:S-(hydroxymethyl)glutathione dehydrogenase/alcohol dehydrogenase